MRRVYGGGKGWSCVRGRERGDKEGKRRDREIDIGVVQTSYKRILLHPLPDSYPHSKSQVSFKHCSPRFVLRSVRKNIMFVLCFKIYLNTLYLSSPHPSFHHLHMCRYPQNNPSFHHLHMSLPPTTLPFFTYSNTA